MAEILLSFLNQMHFDQSTRLGRTHKTLMLGLICARGKRDATISSASRTASGRALTAALGKFIEIEMPEFRFTTIHVNKDWCGALHTDRNNLGPSVMYCVGKHEGGDLWTLDGQTFKRQRTKDTWVEFDGNQPHMTYPYTGGPRYSIVYYTQARIATTPPSEELCAEGIELGIRLPQWPPRPVTRMALAREVIRTKCPELTVELARHEAEETEIVPSENTTMTTSIRAGNKDKWMGFREARQYVHDLRLQNQREWQAWAKGPKRPRQIPSNPNRIYAEWKGTRDWIGQKRTKVRTFNRPPMGHSCTRHSSISTSSTIGEGKL